MEDLAKKHLAEGAVLKIGEDEFNLKPLTIKELPSLMFVMKEMSKKGKENGEITILDAMTPEIITRVTELCTKTIEYSYPDWEESTKDQFVMSNFIPLMTKVFEINNLGANNVDRELANKAKLLAGLDVQKPVK